MATLYGWAIKISWLGADHTYVTSSDGGVWPCWGRGSAGRLICSRKGSSAQANCLSQTDSHAGILYGLTGVCHQTANRILYPARVLVSGASGYWASVLAYGTYGTSNLAALAEWVVRQARCSKISADLRAKALAARAKPAIKPAPADAALQAYLDKVDTLYTQHARTLSLATLADAEPIDFLGEELELMADYRLGAAKAPDSIAALRKAQTDVLQEKKRLNQALIGKKLTADQYARKINQLMAKLMKKSGTLLGKEAHTKLFGIAPQASFKIVDPKILAQYHQ